jgi:3-hydroxy-9,10-secoandrosta-1,3,5(10)-triene-9,17-dione monooxygenase reductase component
MSSSFDPRAYRQALSTFATGVTVITTHWDDSDWIMTCNSFGSVSLNPPLVLWSLRREASSHAAFTQSEGFTVQVLSAHQTEVAQRCASGAMADRWAGLSVQRAPSGRLQLQDALATFDCHLSQAVAAGDHDVLFGEVLSFQHSDGPALLYWRSQFMTTAAV